MSTHVESSMPLVLITDPGEDVDDTFAFFLAATSKKYALKVVISTNEDLIESTGVGKVACYAKKLLSALGREDVEVYQGEQSSKKHRFRCDIDLEPEDLQPQNTEYLEAVRTLADQYSKVMILSIGAMTPLAKIVQADWFNIHQFEVYQMGGNLEGIPPQVEYNIRCDIKAAQAVIHSGADIHLITSDATFQEPMQINEESKVLQQVVLLADKQIPFFQMLLRNYQAFRETLGKAHGYFPYLSDALAFSALEENFVQFSSRKIEVHRSDDTRKDGLIVDSSRGWEIEVSGSQVDHKRFIEYLQKRMDELGSLHAN